MEERFVKDTIDLTYLSSICDNDKQFMREMVENFTRETPQNIAYIAQKIEEEEWIEVKKIAHKMKPAMQFMGLAETLKMVRNLEQHCKEEIGLEKVPTLFEAITSNIHTAINELNLIAQTELAE